jgi:hypothetical protein
MRTTRALSLGLTAAAIAGLVMAGQARLGAQPGGDPAIRVGDRDLGGAVASAQGPEAGVRVIAETADLPYPMGFFTKWLDGRIDDPAGGWKGQGGWATDSTRAPFHVEGGRGPTSQVVKLQLRPDPLAR